MFLSAEKASWNVGEELKASFGCSWHLYLLHTFIRKNSSLYFILGSLTVGELVVFFENFFNKKQSVVRQNDNK